MAKYGGVSAVAIIDGYNWLTSKPKTMSLEIEQITEQTDGLGDNYQAHTPVGKSRAAFDQGGGFFDTATAGLHSVMAAGTPTTPQSTLRIACFGAMGQAVGAVAYGIHGMLTMAYAVLFENSKLTKANVKYLIDGAVDRGNIIQPLATKTADWNTKSLGTEFDYTTDPSQRAIPIASATKASPCVVTTSVPHGLSAGHIILTTGNSLAGPSINSEQAVTVLTTTTFSVAVDTSGSSGAGTGGSFVLSNSVNGAVGYQHVTAFTGFTGYVGKLRDSADNSTFADLITFANITATAGKERATVSGIVDRFLSHDGDVTGSGSIDVFSMISRG